MTKVVFWAKEEVEWKLNLIRKCNLNISQILEEAILKYKIPKEELDKLNIKL